MDEGIRKRDEEFQQNLTAAAFYRAIILGAKLTGELSDKEIDFIARRAFGEQKDKTHVSYYRHELR
jgi:hypothetical protein